MRNLARKKGKSWYFLDMEVCWLRIKFHRNLEFQECVCVCVCVCGEEEREAKEAKNVYLWWVAGCKNFSPVCFSQISKWNPGVNYLP